MRYVLVVITVVMVLGASMARAQDDGTKNAPSLKAIDTEVVPGEDVLAVLSLGNLGSEEFSIKALGLPDGMTFIRAQVVGANQVVLRFLTETTLASGPQTLTVFVSTSLAQNVPVSMTIPVLEAPEREFYQVANQVAKDVVHIYHSSDAISDLQGILHFRMMGSLSEAVHEYTTALTERGWEITLIPRERGSDRILMATKAGRIVYIRFKRDWLDRRKFITVGVELPQAP